MDIDTVGQLAEPYAALFDVLDAQPVPGAALTVAISNTFYARRETSPQLWKEDAHKGAGLKKHNGAGSRKPELVPQARVELATFRLGGGCSIH